MWLSEVKKKKILSSKMNHCKRKKLFVVKKKKLNKGLLFSIAPLVLTSGLTFVWDSEVVQWVTERLLLMLWLSLAWNIIAGIVNKGYLENIVIKVGVFILIVMIFFINIYYIYLNICPGLEESFSVTSTEKQLDSPTIVLSSDALPQIDTVSASSLKYFVLVGIVISKLVF